MGNSQSEFVACSYASTKEKLQHFKVANKPLAKGTGVKSSEHDFDYQVIEHGWSSSSDSEDDELWKDANGSTKLLLVFLYPCSEH